MCALCRSVVMTKIKHLFFLSFLYLACLSFPLKATGFDPLALYLTWQQHPDTTMMIHWITPANLLKDELEYQKIGEHNWHRVKGAYVSMPEKYPYLIYHLELTQLLPYTEYQFRFGLEGKIYKFRTMPTNLITPFRFVVGGDIYHDGLDLLTKMNRQVASLDPLFVVCGGDLVYNEEKPSNLSKSMPRWLDWLIAWKNQLVTTDGRLIPLIPVIGNHEVKGHRNRTPAKAQFFYTLFAKAPAQGYQALDFGNYLSLILLDSEHTHKVEGLQTFWLYTTLKARLSIPYKFPIYHVAAFPSVRKYDNKINKKIRKYWVPLFEKFGVKQVFEHHDHAYKRTRPLLNEKIHPQGIVYLGDGGWAVEKPRIPKDPFSTWYLAKTLASRNVILVNIQEDNCHFTAINEEGQTIDHYSSR